MRIALITDIHEDVVSLKKAFKMIEREKCDHIICLGDILGYPFERAKYEQTRNASECIFLIKNYCSLALLGNHDLFHLKKLPKASSGFKFPPKWYDLTADEQLRIANGKLWNYSDDVPVYLSDKEHEYLSGLPEFEIKEFNHFRIMFSHSFHPNCSGYVSNGLTDNKKVEAHLDYLKHQDCNLGITGHLHVEGLGLAYETGEGMLAQLFKRLNYYSFGDRKLKHKVCCATIPALADNSQVNGFAIFGCMHYSINALSLNTNRRFVL